MRTFQVIQGRVKVGKKHMACCKNIIYDLFSYFSHTMAQTTHSNNPEQVTAWVTLVVFLHNVLIQTLIQQCGPGYELLTQSPDNVQAYIMLYVHAADWCGHGCVSCTMPRTGSTGTATHTELCSSHFMKLTPNTTQQPDMLKQGLCWSCEVFSCHLCLRDTNRGVFLPKQTWAGCQHEAQVCLR